MGDVAPRMHDQYFDVFEARIRADYGLSNRFGIQLDLPVKVTRTRITYRHLDGTPFVPESPGIHHRNETLAGLGDPQLRGRFSTLAAGAHITMAAGMSFPVGSTEPNPFAAGKRGEAHQHVQLGTGTFNPIARIEVSRAISDDARVRGFGAAKLSLYENEHSYQAGSRYRIGFGSRVSPTERLAFSATFALNFERPERWNGEIQQDGNLGRTDALIGAAASYRFDQLTLRGGISFPVYQHIVQTEGGTGQLSFPAIITLGLKRTFSVGPG